MTIADVAWAELGSHCFVFAEGEVFVTRVP